MIKQALKDTHFIILYITKLDAKYCEILADQREKSVLKIPKTILTDLVKNKPLFKLVETWLELKPLFYDGRFRDAKTRVNELSHYLGISKRTYYNRLKELKRLELVHFDKRGDLIICSWVKFFELFGYTTENKRNFKFHRFKNTLSISFAIRQILIENNFAAQKRAIEIKIYLNEIVQGRESRILKQFHEVQQSQTISPLDKKRRLALLTLEFKKNKLKWVNTQEDPEFKKMKQSGMLNRLYLQHWQLYEQQIKRFSIEQPLINPILSISCQKTAALFGLKSKASGHYWQQKFKERGQAKIKRRSVFCPKFNVSEYNFAVRNGVEFEGHYFEALKGVYRRLNNEIYFVPLGTA